MKAYVLTTGIVFALITAAHIARLAAEGTGLAMDPWFLLLTLAAAALAIWALVLFRSLGGRRR